jgi:hypothetical protein
MSGPARQGVPDFEGDTLVITHALDPDEEALSQPTDLSVEVSHALYAIWQTILRREDVPAREREKAVLTLLEALQTTKPGSLMDRALQGKDEA